MGMREEETVGQRQSKRDEQWNARFEELLSYRSGHGDCDVSTSIGKLGRWVSKQRKVYRAGSLPQDRIDRLNSIGFKWAVITGRKTGWTAQFKELVKYKAKHGDCNVLTSQGKLGKWVSHQRTAYMSGSLVQDQIDRLNTIGFKWALIEQSAKVPWETRFKELVQYKTEHGDCNVRQSQGQLGNWVNHQRSNCRDGKLSQDRIDLLNDMGFDWALMEKGPKAPWETRFKELVQYNAVHGDCNVPRSQGQLARWVNNQRTTYKKGKLSQDRITRLNGIGFDWTSPRGGSRKRKATPSIRKLSLSRMESVSTPSTNWNPPSVDTNGFKGEGRNTASSDHPISAPRVSSPCTNVNSPTVGDVARVNTVVPRHHLIRTSAAPPFASYSRPSFEGGNGLSFYSGGPLSAGSSSEMSVFSIPAPHRSAKLARLDSMITVCTVRPEGYCTPSEDGFDKLDRLEAAWATRK